MEQSRTAVRGRRRLGRVLGVLFHDAFVADFYEGDSEDDPEDFADAGEDAGVDADAGGGYGIEHGEDDGEAAFAGSDLHGENVEDIADEGAEAVDDDGVEEGGAGDVEGKEDEEELEGGYEATKGFVDEGAPKLSGVLVEETDVGIGGLEGIIVFLVEATAGAFEPGDKEEDVEEFTEDAVFVAIAEEDDNNQEDNKIDGYKGDDPRGKEVGIKEEEEDTTEGPENEMAVDVHHAVEGDGGDGAWGADVFGEFHDAIGTASETKGGDGGKAEGTDGEFEALAEGEVLIVIGGIDEHLETPCIEAIHGEPDGDDGGKIDKDASAVVADGVPSIGEAEDHDHKGENAENEEYVTV